MSETTLNFILSLNSGKILAKNLKTGATEVLDYDNTDPTAVIPDYEMPPIQNNLVKPRFNYSDAVVNIDAHEGPDEI